MNMPREIRTSAASINSRRTAFEQQVAEITESTLPVSRVPRSHRVSLAFLLFRAPQLAVQAPLVRVLSLFAANSADGPR